MKISDFLDELAAKQSTPGGGGAAALTGSQAAALLCMVANFTLGAKKYADVQEEMKGYLAQAEGLRLRLLELADEDVAAFQARHSLLCHAQRERRRKGGAHGGVAKSTQGSGACSL